ncbi:MAG: hypothetical protein KGH59_02515, partial [Candidatus Micrarchaeota archaeon]|nr:hypothetical protein [Candidatus Micrarchaeota archaeon]
LPPVYFLNTTNACYQCFTDQALVSNLTYFLGAYGILGDGRNMTYINPSQLGTMKPGSLLIVATGLMPVSLTPNSGYQINGSTFVDLLAKGDTVFYVGDNLTRGIGNGGVIFQTSPKTTTLFDNLGLATDAFPARTIGQDPFYLNNPTFQFPYGKNFRAATYAAVNNGTLVVLPNTQRAGWSNSVTLATDIARAMSYRFWIKNLASGSEILTPPSPIGTLGIVGFNSVLNSTVNITQKIDSSYPLVTLAYENSSAMYETDLPFRMAYSSNGSVSIQSDVGQTQVVGIGISMNINASKKQLVVPHIDVYNRNLSYVTSLPIRFFNNTSNVKVILPSSFALPSGTYIGILRDYENRYYSSMVFNVTTVQLTPIVLGWKNNTFEFYLQSNRVPITNATYTINVDGAYNYTGAATNGTILYTLPAGSVVGYGARTFNLYLFHNKYSYTAVNVQKVLNIPAIYIEFLVVGIAVLLLNVIVKPPNRDEYFIDVPEFQQAKKVDVRVGKAEVESVFDKVNFYYHWKYMPLTLEEIKGGISTNIRYNNIPVSITTQNTATIMAKLILAGEVVNSGSFYAPKRWEAESGHDIEYLSVFRRIRDYCVGHAILFTDIGGNEDVDILLSKGGSQARIIIYSAISGSRMIGLSQEIKTYVVFADEEKMLSFSEKLYSSYGPQAELMKMGVSYGYIRLVSAEALDQIVF